MGDSGPCSRRPSGFVDSVSRRPGSLRVQWRTYFFSPPSLSLLISASPCWTRSLLSCAGRASGPAGGRRPDHLHHRLCGWAMATAPPSSSCGRGPPCSQARAVAGVTNSQRDPADCRGRLVDCPLHALRSRGGPVPATVTTSAGLVKKRGRYCQRERGAGQASDVDVEAHRGHGPARGSGARASLAVVGAGQPGVVGAGQPGWGKGEPEVGTNGHRGPRAVLQLRPLLPVGHARVRIIRARRPGRALRAHPGRL